MKRVLLITYGWPPRGGVGTVRPQKWATYLPDHDWAVTVLTPGGAPTSLACPPELGDLPGVEVLDVPYRTWRPVRPVAAGPATRPAAPADRPPGLRQRLKSTIVDILNMPDDLWPWYFPAVQAASERLSRGDISAIVSTSPPETVHLVARTLARKFKLPWVADLRDPWSQDHYRRWPAWKAALLGRMERAVLADAAAIVTVSDRLLADEQRLLGRIRPQDRIIRNGFDPRDIARAPVRSFAPFTLLYSGKLHPEYQDVTALLEAVAQLATRRPLTAETFQLFFRFYGQRVPDVLAHAERLGIRHLVAVGPSVGPQEALGEQRGATALLFVAWQGPGKEAVLTTKVFDYLGAGRPILALGEPEDPPCELVRECRAGAVASRPEALADVLTEWYDRWQAEGRLELDRDEAAVARHTRQAGTAILAEVLDELTGSETAADDVALHAKGLT